MSEKHPERATEPEHPHRESATCEIQDGAEDLEHVHGRLPGLMATLNLEESIGLPTRADGGHDTAQGTHGDVVPQGAHGDETFTMDNPASSDVLERQTGHDDDVSVVPQGTHGDETFSMEMVATTEVVERQARSGNGAMAVSERRERQAVSTRITAGPDFKGIIVQDSSDVNLSLGGQNAGIMKSDSPCKHTDEERSWVGTYATVELHEAVKKYGYKALQFFDVWHFVTFAKHDPDTQQEVLFDTYIDRHFKEKLKASGYPEGCTDHDV
ncbi:uncharacterized protein LOC125379188 [Haliotis rufescens]|uniref:uncharacterized protein LOC125379188 n=1 Tax=Haliotis rufescens TaxID=6454 RepID=UPI00201EB737|nr:uncharacterized protein LOC125379188 [Haliotis rufescens]